MGNQCMHVQYGKNTWLADCASPGPTVSGFCGLRSSGGGALTQPQKQGRRAAAIGANCVISRKNIQTHFFYFFFKKIIRYITFQSASETLPSLSLSILRKVISIRSFTPSSYFLKKYFLEMQGGLKNAKNIIPWSSSSPCLPSAVLSMLSISSLVTKPSEFYFKIIRY